MNSITRIAKEKSRRTRLIYAAVISMVATSFMVTAAPIGSAATTLYVAPDNQTVVYGSAVFPFTVKYETVNNNLGSVIADPSVGNVGWVVPTCASTPAYSSSTPVGTAVISCSGGNGGTLYALNTSDTATVTINKVGTKIQVSTTPTGAFLPGATFSFSATVSPVTGTGVCTGAVTFALDRNPLTGAAGSYPITNPVVTTNWMAGTYHLMATYPGDSNCLASSNNSTQVKVGTQDQDNEGAHAVVSGGGSYISPYGKASFNLLIKSGLQNFDTSTAVTGKVTWMVPKQWKFQGTINSYSLVNGNGTASGSGTLLFWNRAGEEGKWFPATVGAANVTVNFTVAANANGEHSRPITSFAIGFTGTSAAGAPALPPLGALVAVGSGENQNNDHGQGSGHGQGKGNEHGHGHGNGQGKSKHEH